VGQHRDDILGHPLFHDKHGIHPPNPGLPDWRRAIVWRTYQDIGNALLLLGTSRCGQVSELTRYPDIIIPYTRRRAILAEVFR
jgi:hypothetical protein